MKKLILALIAVLFGMSSANAQHYRGFLDMTVSMPVTKIDGGRLQYDASGVLLGATTSHGVQLKNVFIGAGIGVSAMPSSYGCGLPLFVDGRYDFFGFSKANLFIGCKLGYMPWLYDEEGLSLKTSDYYTSDHAIFRGYLLGKLSGLYFNPSVGVRFRLTDVLGINIALSYLPIQFECTSFDYISENYNIYNIGDKFIDHCLALSIGVDF